MAQPDLTYKGFIDSCADQYRAGKLLCPLATFVALKLGCPSDEAERISKEIEGGQHGTNPKESHAHPH